MDYDREYLPGMERLIALYPQRYIRKATITEYFTLLRDLDPAAFTDAIAHCGRTCKWFPTVAELVAAAGVTSIDLENQRAVRKLHRDKARYEAQHLGGFHA